ncbi:MAG: hypothetical protein FWC59_01700, partial [Actinomycetia bacterium]|nr:hypothetical protein [Actinomycetes bacterium]
LLYAANSYRPEGARASSALALLRQIETQSGLAVSGIIGNSHLKALTDIAVLMAKLPELQQLAARAQLPILAVSAPAALAGQLGQAWEEQSEPAANRPPIWPVQTLVKTSWE